MNPDISNYDVISNDNFISDYDVISDDNYDNNNITNIKTIIKKVLIGSSLAVLSLAILSSTILSNNNNTVDDKIVDDKIADDKIVDDKIVDDITKKTTKKTPKKSIPATLKRKVWNKYIGEDIGKSTCLCCKLSTITQLSFNCGHIIAESKGGELKMDNLKPICQSCNSSMGTMNMDEYMLKLGF
jgi:hypothetical protein